MNETEQLTELSGDRCSAGDNLRLYEAHKISRDFFRVSSVLQAVNKAAAAASWSRSQLVDRCICKLLGEENTYDIMIFTIIVSQSELMVIDTSRVEGPNGPEEL
jgi:hypothetical protein